MTRLSRDWTPEELAERVAAFLRVRPEGATETELVRWVRFIDEATLSTAIVKAVESGQVCARWSDASQDWVFTRTDRDTLPGVPGISSRPAETRP